MLYFRDRFPFSLHLRPGFGSANPDTSHTIGTVQKQHTEKDVELVPETHDGVPHDKHT